MEFSTDKLLTQDPNERILGGVKGFCDSWKIHVQVRLWLRHS